MMTSVQPTQAPAVNGIPLIPPGLGTPQQILAKYRELKQKNTPETDPELIKYRQALEAIQRLTQLQKKKQELNADGKVNGAALEHNGVKDNTIANGAVNGTAPSTQLVNGTSDPVKPLSSFLTHKQMTLFKMQINAYRILSKNLPLNAQIQQALFGGKQLDTPASSLNASTGAVGAGAGPSVIAAQNDLSGIPPGDKYAIPHPKIFNALDKYKKYVDPLKLISPIVHSNLRKDRDIIPTSMPIGVNVSKILEDREMIIYNRMEHRKKELAQMHSNIASWNSNSSELQQEDLDIKRKLVIEYKKLNLLEKQRKLRATISREMINADNLAMTANRSHYRRIKKQNVRESRMAEKLERQQRELRENKERKKHIEFLTDLQKHAVDFRRTRDSRNGKTVRLGRMMLQQHQTLEKEEQKRIERTAKQRLQALKANDEETYLKLLGQAKDTRISHLLSQTDGFLKQLAASVKAQQRTAVQQYRDRSEPETEDEEESDEEGGPRVDYYEVAHRIKEDVVAQSTNLVGGTLKEYQLKGLQWMLSLYNNNLNGILADEMGLGKTIQTISLITYLIEKKREQGPFLVIVPLSTLTNWNNEFDKWAPSVKKIVYKGPPNQRKTQQQQIRWGQFQVLLTTYEFIIKDRPILAKVKWLHMIVDEGHRMKNAKSKLSSTITEYYTTRYRLILTGTPLQNNLPELWALLNFVLPNIFKSVKSFDEWFNTPFANTGGQDKMELTEEEQLLVIKRLHKVLRPFLLRRLKKDVEKDLPDKTERVIKCNFSALQAKLYKQLVTGNNLIVSDGKGGKTGMRGLSNMLMQLRKVCNHPFVYEQIEDQINPTRGTNDTLWRTAGKFELLDRVLPKFKASGHRVLMFFQMTQIMNIMEDFMRYRGMTYLRLDGSTKADDRSDLLRLFNAPDSPYFCFLLSTRAGGLGLNLQTADTVIIFDSDWNPHQDLQAQDRAHRIGQKNEVRILRLITSNSVEEKILERANFKLDMDGKVIQAGKFDNKSTNEEREAMLRIMLESAEAAETMEQDEMDDDDLNLMMMRSDEELVLFQRMDEERNRDDPFGPAKQYPRLMSDAELPDIYLNDDVPEEVNIIEESYGRGARERTRVKYDDGLTEEQWLEAVDNSEDDLDAAIARKEARVARRHAKKDKNGRDVESPVPSRESSASPAPKKRGRKPKAETKRKIEEVEPEGTPETTGPRKRGRQAASKVEETLTSDQRVKLQGILNSVYDELMELEEEDEDDEQPPRSIIALFKELPDKYDYPDYYVVIQNPIAMAQIKKKINRRDYQSPKEFFDDVKLLCDNCRTYNEPSSILYEDANLIQQTTIDRLKKECADISEWQTPYPSPPQAESQPSPQAQQPVQPPHTQTNQGAPPFGFNGMNATGVNPITSQFGSGY